MFPELGLTWDWHGVRVMDVLAQCLQWWRHCESNTGSLLTDLPSPFLPAVGSDRVRKGKYKQWKWAFFEECLGSGWGARSFEMGSEYISRFSHQKTSWLKLWFGDMTLIPHGCLPGEVFWTCTAGRRAWGRQGTLERWCLSAGHRTTLISLHNCWRRCSGKEGLAMWFRPS